MSGLCRLLQIPSLQGVAGRGGPGVANRGGLPRLHPFALLRAMRAEPRRPRSARGPADSLHAGETRPSEHRGPRTSLVERLPPLPVPPAHPPPLVPPPPPSRPNVNNRYDPIGTALVLTY